MQFIFALVIGAMFVGILYYFVVLTVFYAFLHAVVPH